MIGKTLGHFRIEEKLGEGGMGVVYRALDTHLDRNVAIKVLRSEAMQDPERNRRFVQEARAASALNHPNIVTIYDISTAEGMDFIAMEYVQGQTLEQFIGRRGLRVGEALRYAVQVADALARAHSAGIVHRDLKPANLMVRDDGLVKVLDFGLAKLTETTEAEESPETQTIHAGQAARTQEGAILGTVAYMSPEQAEGRQVDRRSDIFSFGVVLYQMLSGRPPFQGQTKLSTLSAILREEPKPLNQVVERLPRDLEKVITRCLRKDPYRRFQHMDDLRVALEEIREESESGVAEVMAATSLAPQQPRPPRHWIRRVVPVALLGLALAIGGAVWLRARRPWAGPRTVPFTGFPGQERHPAFSPDGKQLAFIWKGETGGNFDIYVKPIDGGTALRLTTNAADEVSPAWSPDGRDIAFLRRAAAGSGIFVIPSVGGPERQVGQSSTGAGLSWSADGKFLAIADKTSAREPAGIFSISLETGEKRRLTSPPAEYFGDGFPAFSPDGQTLAFLRTRISQVSDIYLLALAGGSAPWGEPRRLTIDVDIAGLAWTPDGRSIVFSSTRGGSRSLWKVSATASTSGGGPERLAAVGEDASFPSISSVSGRPSRLAYEESVVDSNIWRIARPGSMGQAPPDRGSVPTRLISSVREDASPQVSPDGKRIVFASTRSGNWEIWVCDSEGLNPVQLTSFAGPHVGTPRWSPDGQRIVFDYLKEHDRDIYGISAQGGPPRRLTTEPSDEVRPSWSRDGRWIYFGSNRSGSWQVWKAPAEGGTAVQVTRHGGREAFESPDGKFVYYARIWNELGIWRAPVEGGEETQVIEQVVQGDWAVLDQGIYFLNRRAMPQPTIEFFNFATRRTERIAALPRQVIPLWAGAPSFAVSPDGRWILYMQWDRVESDIVLVENFR